MAKFIGYQSYTFIERVLAYACLLLAGTVFILLYGITAYIPALLSTAEKIGTR